MTTISETKWLSKYLKIKIIPHETQLQDLVVRLAKKVEKLEKKGVIV